MTINFEPPVPVYSAVRQNPFRIAEINDFVGIKEGLLNNEEEPAYGSYKIAKFSGESYSGYNGVHYGPDSHDGAECFKVRYVSANNAYWEAAQNRINTSYAVNVIGDEEATAQKLPDMFSFAFQVRATMGSGDGFVMRFTNDKVVASNYKNQATLTSLEALCEVIIDTIEP